MLRRNVVDLKVLEPWVNRIAAAAGTMGSGQDRDPFLDTGNAQAFLRALYLQLAWPRTRRRCAPTCSWSSSRSSGRPTRTIWGRPTRGELACAA